MRAPASPATGPHGQASLLAGSPSRAEPSAVEAGAEIGAALWGGRVLVDAPKVTAALSWVRGSRRTAAAASSGEAEPALLLESLAADETAPSPIAGVLERAGRDLRLALAFLSRCKLTPPFDGGYEPKAEDALETLGDVERALVAMTRAVYLEADGAVLAVHAAARGAVPMALGAPGEFDPGPVPALVKVGRALGVDGCDVAAAQAVARVWGVDELGEGEARKLLGGLVRLREALAQPQPEDEDDGGGAAPAAQEGKPRAPRGEPGAGFSASACWGPRGLSRAGAS